MNTTNSAVERASACHDEVRGLAEHARELLHLDLEHGKDEVRDKEDVERLRAHVDTWERAVIQATERAHVAADAMLEQLELTSETSEASENTRAQSLHEQDVEHALASAQTPLRLLRTLVTNARACAALVSRTSSDSLQVEFQRAVFFGDRDVVELFLHHGRADPTAHFDDCDEFDRSFDSLCVACVHGHAPVVALLLEDGRANPAANDSESLRSACAHGHAPAVALLLADGRADPAANESAALQHACKHGHADVVLLLLQDRRADPTVDDSVCVNVACVDGHDAIVKHLLMDGRADPRARASRALKYATLAGRASVVALLLQDGRADPAEGDSLLNAVVFGNATILRLLLQDGRANPASNNSVCAAFARNRNMSEMVDLFAQDGRAALV
jgi:ankyrin repeat protein